MIFLYILILSAHSHSGNTDTSGCHAGLEPYHCHGASASSQVESRWLEIQEESRASIAKMEWQNTLEDIRKMAEAKHKECAKLSTKEYTIQWNPVTGDCSKPYCNYGFKEIDNKCLKVYVPDNSVYDDKTKSFACNYGFKEVNNECIKVYVPDNARYDDETKSFICYYRFKKVNNECIKVYVPDNAHYDDRAKSFVCYYGFKEVEITIDDWTGEKARVCISSHSSNKHLNE